MQFKLNRAWGFVGLLGLLGYVLNEPLYYVFFTFFIFFADPVFWNKKNGSRSAPPEEGSS
jgi:hypothetical protein